MGIRTIDILKLMIRLGERPFSAEQPMNKEVVELICEELYFEPIWEKATFEEDVGPVERPEDMSHFPRRPLVVTIMGHVDHGKTTLLDKLRNANVAEHEQGGITQHVSVFQTKMKESQEVVTFMDTPGHAAFAAIRERGTKMTDIALLVIACDDGIQDQTEEALAYLKEQKTPFIVVLTKIEKRGNVADAIYMELLRKEVSLEKYGGDVPSVEISAMTGKNMDLLEDAILMMAESLDCRADPKSSQTEASVVESSVDRQSGQSSTVIVEWGTLKVGQNFVVGTTYGRVKSLRSTDEKEILEEAPPSMPVLLFGMKELPSPGDRVITVDTEKTARKISENRAFVLSRQRTSETEERKESVFVRKTGGKVTEEEKKSLNIILKVDVEGSLEAMTGLIDAIPQDEVDILYVKKGVGEVTLADVELGKQLFFL